MRQRKEKVNYDEEEKDFRRKEYGTNDSVFTDNKKLAKSYQLFPEKGGILLPRLLTPLYGAPQAAISAK